MLKAIASNIFFVASSKLSKEIEKYLRNIRNKNRSLSPKKCCKNCQIR